MISVPCDEPVSTGPELNDAQWFKTCILPHEPALRGYLRNRFASVPDIEDVMQEAYVRLLRERSRKTIIHARYLLYTIARRVALDVIRRQRICPFVDISFEQAIAVPDATQSVQEHAARGQEKQLLHDAIMALTERRRTALKLTRFEGLSGREAGDRMGVTESSVNNHVSAAVRQCRLFFRDYGACASADDDTPLAGAAGNAKLQSYT